MNCGMSIPWTVFPLKGNMVDFVYTAIWRNLQRIMLNEKSIPKGYILSWFQVYDIVEMKKKNGEQIVVTKDHGVDGMGEKWVWIQKQHEGSLCWKRFCMKKFSLLTESMSYLYCDIGLYFFKILTLGETGWKVYKRDLCIVSYNL